MFSIYLQTYNGAKEIRTGPEPRVNFIPVNLVTQIRLYPFRENNTERRIGIEYLMAQSQGAIYIQSHLTAPKQFWRLKISKYWEVQFLWGKHHSQTFFNLGAICPCHPRHISYHNRYWEATSCLFLLNLNLRCDQSWSTRAQTYSSAWTSAGRPGDSQIFKRVYTRN